MSPALQWITADDRSVELRCGGALLLRYVFNPDTPENEAPRPYAHPVRSLGGAELTNFRPNDHPWHHGLSLTINNAGGTNFWGGPTYRRADGYRWREDQGRQIHRGWGRIEGGDLTETVAWHARAGERLLLEQRELSATLLSATTWTLRWRSELENVSGRTLTLGNYHSAEGLAGSHYTGLQFRGARDLLDEHGDAAVGVFAEGGLSGEAAVHGTAATWMEWRGQKDTSLQRVTLRFANAGGPLHWFLRRNNPLAAFSFHHDRNVDLPPGGRLQLDHTLTFADA